MVFLKRPIAPATLSFLAFLTTACERELQIGFTHSSAGTSVTETAGDSPASGVSTDANPSQMGNADAPAAGAPARASATSQAPANPSPAAPAPTPVAKSDRFNVKANKKIDILMVIDNSGSMGDKQQILKDSFAAFITDFIAKGLDFHIGIITTDVDTPNATNQWAATLANGKANPIFAYADYKNPVPGGLLSKTADKFLTGATPNLSDAFKTNASVGVSGSGSERGLASISMSLGDALRNGYNNGFIRDDAYLSVVVFSDENELVDKSTAPGSTNNDCGIRNAAHDTDRLNSLVTALKKAKQGSLARVRLDAFVGTTLAANDARAANSACNPINRDPLMNYSMYKSAVDTVKNGGEVQNILKDFSVPLANVGSRIATQAERTYTLAKAPVSQGSINVSVDGMRVAQDANNGWTYDAASRQITLNGSALPDNDFSLEVDYQTLP